MWSQTQAQAQLAEMQLQKNRFMDTANTIYNSSSGLMLSKKIQPNKRSLSRGQSNDNTRDKRHFGLQVLVLDCFSALRSRARLASP